MSENLETLVETYLDIRTERQVLLRDFEAADSKLKEDMEKLEAAMLTVCNSVNANSINTAHGTVIRKLNTRYVCKDWDNFKSFVLEHRALDLFEKRVHQGNFAQFMEGNKDSGLPPGIDVMRSYDVMVRKSSSK